MFNAKRVECVCLWCRRIFDLQPKKTQPFFGIAIWLPRATGQQHEWVCTTLLWAPWLPYLSDQDLRMSKFISPRHEHFINSQPWNLVKTRFIRFFSVWCWWGPYLAWVGWLGIYRRLNWAVSSVKSIDSTVVLSSLGIPFSSLDSLHFLSSVSRNWLQPSALAT